MPPFTVSDSYSESNSGGRPASFTVYEQSRASLCSSCTVDSKLISCSCLRAKSGHSGKSKCPSYRAGALQPNWCHMEMKELISGERLRARKSDGLNRSERKPTPATI